MEAVDLLADFVDESDPDAQFANSIHAFQTAEAIRAEHPDDDWFQLTGLIHDLGKVMAKYGQPQVCTSLLGFLPYKKFIGVTNQNRSINHASPCFEWVQRCFCSE